MEPWRTARTARAVASSTCSSVSLGHRAEPGRDVDVGRGEHLGPVEDREQAVSPQGEPAVVSVVDHESATSPASRSESSSTIAAGGCQANTPHGWPSTSGVSGPHMPRT